MLFMSVKYVFCLLCLLCITWCLTHCGIYRVVLLIKSPGVLHSQLMLFFEHGIITFKSNFLCCSFLRGKVRGHNQATTTGGPTVTLFISVLED